MNLFIFINGEKYADGQIFETARKQPIKDVYSHCDFNLNQNTEIDFQRRPSIDVICPICQKLNATIYVESNRLWCHHCRVSFNPVDLVAEVRSLDMLDAAEWILRRAKNNNFYRE